MDVVKDWHDSLHSFVFCGIYEHQEAGVVQARNNESGWHDQQAVAGEGIGIEVSKNCQLHSVEIYGGQLAD